MKFATLCLPLAVSLLSAAAIAQTPKPLVDLIGSGEPGLAGVPQFSMGGAPVEGAPFQLGVTSAIASSVGALILSPTLSPVPLPQYGGTLYPGFPFSLLPFAIDASGKGLALDAGPVSPALSGIEFYAQAIILDPSTIGNLSSTAAVHVRFGQGAGGPLFLGQVLTALETPTGVFAADLNADGVDDLIVPHGSGEISVLLGGASGAFEPEVFYPASAAPAKPEVAIADFNGDQNLDLAVTSKSTKAVYILIGLGDGTFLPTTSVPLGFSYWTILAGDFNGDSKVDLAVGGGNAPVSILLGTGTGTFATPSTLPSSKNASSMSMGLIDGDTILDLAIATVPGNAASVFLGNGDGTFLAPLLVPTSATDLDVIRLYDFDGDAALDIAVSGAGGMVVCLGNGDGTFSTGTTLPATALPPPRSFVAADVTGDQILDIIACQGQHVGVWPGVGNGTFSSPFTYPEVASPLDLAVGNFNGDSLTDLVIVDPLVGHIAPFWGSPSGLIPPSVPPTFPAGPGASFVAQGDLDGDQVVDLVATCSDSDQVAVLYGLGDGAFAPVSLMAVGAFPQGLALADLNGDNADDIVVANRVSHDISVLLSDGLGSFLPATTYPAVKDPISVVLTDFNGDGILDVATANLAGGGVLLGAGNGSFLQVLPFAGPAKLNSIAAGDFDKDSLQDLVLVGGSSGSGSTRIAFGQGDGTFLMGPQLPSGKYPVDVAVGDLSGDQILDFAVTDPATQEILVYKGIGGGAFISPISIPAKAHHDNIHIADINADLLPDLVLGGLGIKVYFGDGTGPFGDILTLNLGDVDVLDLASGDLDGDLLTDVAAVGLLTSNFYVLLNKMLE